MPIELDGNLLAAKIKMTLHSEILRLKALGYRAPHLCILVVGTNINTAVYVNDKQEACSSIDMICTASHFNTSISTSVLLSKIAQLNRDPLVDGIILQLPLPSHIDSSVLAAIDPQKDVARVQSQGFTTDTLQDCNIVSLISAAANGLDTNHDLPMLEDQNSPLSIALQLRNTLTCSVGRQWASNSHLDKGLFPMYRARMGSLGTEVEQSLVQESQSSSFINSMS